MTCRYLDENARPSFLPLTMAFLDRLALVLLIQLLAISSWSHCVAGKPESSQKLTVLGRYLHIRGGSSLAFAEEAIMTTAQDTFQHDKSEDNATNKQKSLLIVFSDLDGTLIHYPDSSSESSTNEQNQPDTSSILQLPPSSTGMVGIISHQTLNECRNIRRAGVKLVLVSGMRSSTLLKRLPYLPKADAYCCEAGGRIYYPISSSAAAVNDDDSSTAKHRIVPVSYSGAEQDDLAPFEIQEDVDWRRRVQEETAAGPDGFVGNDNRSPEKAIPLVERRGLLWTFAQSLENQGLVVDVHGYATCFRVNRNQQPTDEAVALFDQLLRGDLAHPSELATSVNLGCIDFYPSMSGKKHCCQYLAEHFGGGSPSQQQLLSDHCVCLCDDDNDVEMALACSHAYIPSVSSDSMWETIQEHPGKFTVTFQAGEREGVEASEAALALILKRIIQAKL